MEAALMERDTPNADRTRDQSYRARMGPLLRPILPGQVGRIPQTHRRVFGALGNAEVQATKRPPQASLGVSGKRVRTRARALCSLEGGTGPRPDGGSRMSGDVHVRFCESLGLQRPGPLTKKKHTKKKAKAKHKKPKKKP